MKVGANICVLRRMKKDGYFHIGNRTETKVGGDEGGTSLRTAVYNDNGNKLNRYANRHAPRTIRPGIFSFLRKRDWQWSHFSGPIYLRGDAGAAKEIAVKVAGVEVKFGTGARIDLAADTEWNAFTFEISSAVVYSPVESTGEIHDSQTSGGITLNG